MSKARTPTNKSRAKKASVATSGVGTKEDDNTQTEIKPDESDNEADEDDGDESDIDTNDDGDSDGDSSSDGSEDKLVPHLRLVDTSKPAAAPVQQVWEMRLLKAGKKGAPRKILANAIVPLRFCPDLQGALRYNEFSATIEVCKALPWDEVDKEFKARPWSEFDVLRYTEWLQKRTIDVSKTLALDAAYTVSWEHRYHPVRDWLNGLVWDGEDRLGRFLPTYFLTEDTAYERMVGPKIAISSVARVMEPGCKADCMAILIGDQGKRKSTGIERLYGKVFFTDEIKAVSGNKEVAMSLKGKWAAEFPDLEGFRGRDAEDLKAYIARTTDRYRSPYGHYTEDHPRQNIFFGTTNQLTPLKDFTGNRRYWPLKVGNVNVEAIEQDREQLWAEAVVRYRRGEAWWLETIEERALADEKAKEAQEIDLWQEILEEELINASETTIEIVLVDIMGIEAKKVSRRDQMRAANALQALGFIRVRGTETKTRRRYWKYQRANSSENKEQS